MVGWECGNKLELNYGRAHCVGMRKSMVGFENRGCKHFLVL